MNIKKSTVCVTTHKAGIKGNNISSVPKHVKSQGMNVLFDTANRQVVFEFLIKQRTFGHSNPAITQDSYRPSQRTTYFSNA